MEFNDFSHVKPMPQFNTTRTRRFDPYDRPRRIIPPRVYHVLTVNPRSSQHGAQLHTIHDLSVTPASRH